MDFEPSGDLLSDLSQAIEYGNAIQLEYTDKKGVTTDRKILPLEIRADKLYVADLDKMALRLFLLENIGQYEVLDEVYDKDNLSLTNV